MFYNYTWKYNKKNDKIKVKRSKVKNKNKAPCNGDNVL